MNTHTHRHTQRHSFEAYQEIKSSLCSLHFILETPSKPYCSIHGNSHLGQTAILACHSEHGSPTPTYNWTRVGEVQTKTGVDGKRELSLHL